MGLNLPTILVLAAVALLAVLAVVSLVRHRKRACGSCPLGGICGKNGRS